MARRTILDPALPEPAGVFVHAVEVPLHGKVIYISGLTAQDHDGEIIGRGDVARQAAVIFDHMARLLHRADATLDDVVKLTVFTTDMDRWEDVTDERRRRFTQDRPAATMVEVSRFRDPDALLEVEAVVHVFEEPA